MGSNRTTTNEADGMTLYKAMGYGLTGLQLDDRGRVIDDRINTSSILLDGDREDEATVRNYVRHGLDSDENLEAILKGWHWGHMDPESIDPFEAVEDFSETSLEGALLLRPVGFRDWNRHGSLLDTYDEHSHGNVMEQDRLVTLSGGIYPYSNTFMDTETCEQVGWDVIGNWVFARNSGHNTVEHHASKALELLGWGDIGHEGLNRRIAPMPPKEIIELAAFGKLFTDPKTVFELRPMFATFWR